MRYELFYIANLLFFYDLTTTFTNVFLQIYKKHLFIFSIKPSTTFFSIIL